jgi:two-component system, OmpR family, response regulator RegX3
MTSASRILVVDDDPGVLDVVSYALESEGFAVEAAEDAAGALAAAERGGFDLVVLDLMLPDLPGTDVCRKLRAAGNAIPILMLTAKDAEIDRIVGLEIGADDYVTKPFSKAELVSRVRAILRRRELDREERGPGSRRVGGIELDFGRHEVRVDGELISLTPSEFKLLALLSERPEQTFTRREMMQHLWQSTHVGDEHACDVHISNLRHKIERDPEHPERIVTVRGFGYALRPA